MTQRLKILDENLYVTYALLREYDVAYNTIDKGVNRFRNNKQCTWENFKDKYVWIKYTSIPTRTKEKYKLPTEEKLREQYELFIEAEKNKKKSAEKSNKVMTCYRYLNDALAVHQYTYSYVDILKGNRDKAIAYSKRYSILCACIELENGGHTKEDIYRAYQIIEDSDLKKYNGGAYSLFRPIEKIKDEGLKGLLDGRTGSEKPDASRKFKTELKIVLEKAYSVPDTTIGHLKIISDNYCDERGWERISESSIKAYLCKPEIRNRISAIKYGKAHFENTQKPFINRKKPSYSCSKVVIDGTPLQIISKDKEGRQIRLQIFVVLDVHSGKIIGYDISRSETAFSVQMAIKRAVKNTGLLPREIVSDNSSAIKSKETQHLFKRFEMKGASVRYAKVGNAKDKEVEQFFRTIHGYFRTIPGWIGANITSSSKEYRPAKEYVNKAYRQNGIPNENDTKKLVIDIIEQYNNDSLNGRNSPSKIFEASRKTYAIEFKPTDFLFLFWGERITTVRNSMVLRTIGKKKLYYLVNSDQKKLELNGKEVLMKMDNEDLTEVHLFDPKTSEFLSTCKLRESPNSAQAEQTEKDKFEIMRQSNQNESYRKYIRRETQKRVKIYQEITGKTDIDYKGVFQLRKEAIINNEFSELSKYYQEFRIDPTDINPKIGRPVKSEDWDNDTLKKDYTKNPYERKGDLSVVNKTCEKEMNKS